jgi:hypothetical protein
MRWNVSIRNLNFLHSLDYVHLLTSSHRCYFVVALGQCNGGRKREVRIEGGSATMTSDISFNRKGSSRAATNLMENVSFLSP